AASIERPSHTRLIGGERRARRAIPALCRGWRRTGGVGPGPVQFCIALGESLMGDASSLGFGHFIAQADIVAKVLLAVLAIMSAISWYLIVYKGIGQVVRQKRSQKFLTF